MPALDWNHLRSILAVARSGTFAAAARRLGVNETTVARHVAAAERTLGARIFQRVAGGRLRPTDAGEVASTHAERIEQQVGALTGEIGGHDRHVAGNVRLTSVPLLVNRVFAPAAGELLRRHPRLRLELVADPADLSLGKREADVAVRLARPSGRQARAIARRIGRLDYIVAVPAACAASEERRLPWITYVEEMSGLPQAAWMEARGAGSSSLVVNDAEAVIRAVAAGLGRSLLPAGLTDRLHGIRLAGESVLSREIWLLVHEDQRQLARVRATIEWIEATIGTLISTPTPPSGAAAPRGR
jgi:DNA-binding transcriptional LysR family regulator